MFEAVASVVLSSVVFLPAALAELEHPPPDLTKQDYVSCRGSVSKHPPLHMEAGASSTSWK